VRANPEPSRNDLRSMHACFTSPVPATQSELILSAAAAPGLRSISACNQAIPVFPIPLTTSSTPRCAVKPTPPPGRGITASNTQPGGKKPPQPRGKGNPNHAREFCSRVYPEIRFNSPNQTHARFARIAKIPRSSAGKPGAGFVRRDPGESPIPGSGRFCVAGAIFATVGPHLVNGGPALVVTIGEKVFQRG